MSFIGKRIYEQHGFSLLEMILALSLSGIIMVAVMALVLSFSNIFLSSKESGTAEINKICYEKFINSSIKECCKFNILEKKFSFNFLEHGIFWESKHVPAFVDDDLGDSYILGLLHIRNHFQFLWTRLQEMEDLEDVDFRTIDLIEDVKSVCLLVYDADKNRWNKENFDEETVRYFLHKGNICYLRVKTGTNAYFFPMFDIGTTF